MTPKLVPGYFVLKIEYKFFIKHFALVTGDMHVETWQCVVLSRLAFPAITIFATGLRPPLRSFVGLALLLAV